MLNKYNFYFRTKDILLIVKIIIIIIIKIFNFTCENVLNN